MALNRGNGGVEEGAYMTLRCIICGEGCPNLGEAVGSYGGKP